MTYQIPAMYQQRPSRFGGLFKAAPIGGIAPTTVEIAGLWIVWLILFILEMGEAFSIAVILGPVLIAGAMGLANWQMVRNAPASIWSALFSFRLGVMVFFGIGSIVPYLVDPIQIDRMMALYAYSDAEVAKLLIVWLFYAAIILTFAKLAANIIPQFSAETLGGPITWLTSGRLGMVFFAIGIGYGLIIELGLAIGWFSFVLPGAISTVFQAISAVGVFLIALTAFERKGAWFIALASTLLFSVSLSLILYNKTGVLFPLLLVGIALLIRRVTIPRIAFVVGLLVFVLQILQPAIEDARIRHELIFGQGDGGAVAAGTVPERLDIVLAYWREGPVGATDLGQGITRLTYLNIGTYLVTEYDLGIGGETMSGALYTLIPRVIWPNKPIVTDVGKELHERIFGEAVSFIAPTTPADIYWNYGWVGILLIAPVLGICVWLASLATVGIVRNADWFMMPFVLIAFRTALGLDQAFVVGVFVPSVFSLLLFYALRTSKKLLSLNENRSPRPAGATAAP